MEHAINIWALGLQKGCEVCAYMIDKLEYLPKCVSNPKGPRTPIKRL